MFLNLENRTVSMKLIYTLEEALKHDDELIALTQARNVSMNVSQSPQRI